MKLCVCAAFPEFPEKSGYESHESFVPKNHPFAPFFLLILKLLLGVLREFVYFGHKISQLPTSTGQQNLNLNQKLANATSVFGGAQNCVDRKKSSGIFIGCEHL